MEEAETIWYRDVIKESTTYYYPIDMELRMLNAVKIGELQEVHRILNSCWHTTLQNGSSQRRWFSNYSAN